MERKHLVRIEVIVETDTGAPEMPTRIDDYGAHISLLAYEDGTGVFLSAAYAQEEWAHIEQEAGKEPLLDNLIAYCQTFTNGQRVKEVRVLLDGEEISRLRPDNSSFRGTWTGIMWAGGELHRLTGRLPLSRYRAVMARRKG